jgi:DNA-binding response OmpR family regulator
MACILVINDDRLLRGNIELILESEGHAVVPARNGHEGMKRFRSGRFDLVACDISMPNSEGMDTIRELRHLSAALPIIAFTEGPCPADGEDHAAGPPGGMEMLAKPFRRQELVALVRRCLHSAAGS